VIALIVDLFVVIKLINRIREINLIRLCYTFKRLFSLVVFNTTPGAYFRFCIYFRWHVWYRHVLLSNAIHLLNKIFFKLNMFVQTHVADSWNTVCEKASKLSQLFPLNIYNFFILSTGPWESRLINMLNLWLYSKVGIYGCYFLLLTPAHST
jgi:hypothetical protein